MMLTSNNNNNSNNNCNNNSNNNSNLSIPLKQLSDTSITTTATTINNNIYANTHTATNAITNSEYINNLNNTKGSTSNIDNFVTVSNRRKDDVCQRLFGNTLDKTIRQILYFTTTNDQNRLKIQAFAHQQTLFLMFSKETIEEVFSWSPSRFQSWFTYLIDISEKQTGCIYMIVAINKQQNKVETILRTFYYIGFQLVEPTVYNHSPDYILVGYELD
ncbi:hypothetical protein BJ944DRAFT_259175 [Cunninghamella echinulata]|nr:hypothetical protein BJ944DRAFT_259175 [Cunninghamella echinulata]